MRGDPSIPTSPALRWLTRLLWLALIAMHIPALGGASAGIARDLVAGSVGSERIMAIAGLLAAIILFTAKLIDVPWLRLPTRRHSLVAFCVIAALAHPEAIGLEHEELATPHVVAVLVGTIVTDRVIRNRPHVRECWRRFIASLSGIGQELALTGRFSAESNPPIGPAPAVISRAPRAPPF